MHLPVLLGPTISSPEALHFEESLVGQMYYYAAKMVSYGYPCAQVWLDFYFSNFVYTFIKSARNHLLQIKLNL